MAFTTAHAQFYAAEEDDTQEHLSSYVKMIIVCTDGKLCMPCVFVVTMYDANQRIAQFQFVDLHPRFMDHNYLI